MHLYLIRHGQSYINLPLVFRATVSAHLNTLQGVEVNGWESSLWNIQEWRRTKE